MHKLTWFFRSGLVMVVSVALLTGLAVSPAGAASASRISADVQTTPTAQLSDEERQALSVAAGRLFIHVDLARKAIASKDKAGALENVTKGLTLAEIIKKAEPDYTVKSTIKAGNLVYEDERTVKPAMVPIFNELDRISLEEPVQVSALHAARNASTAPVVEDVESMRSLMKLDVNLAQDHLQVAQTTLRKGDLKLADAALSTIQNDAVSFQFDAMDRPLVDARENLMLAKTMIQEGKPADARAELQAASDALKEYQDLAGEHRATEVRAMRDEIEKLTPEIEKNRSESIGRITALWDQLIKWL
jgi:hypothetical protein